VMRVNALLTAGLLRLLTQATQMLNLGVSCHAVSSVQFSIDLV
jgi:hypothetical protein